MSSSIFIVIGDDSTRISCGIMPKNETTNVSPILVLISKTPSKLLDVPSFVPLIIMVAPGSGSPVFTSTIFPLSNIFCATIIDGKKSTIKSIFNFILFECMYLQYLKKKKLGGLNITQYS